MYLLDDYNYDLPEKLIAQQPAQQRDRSKLMLLRRKTGRLEHHTFSQLVDLLDPSDTLVINNTEVIPGRLYGNKETGGKIEVLILDYSRRQRKRNNNGTFLCECLIKTSKRPQKGASIYFDQGLKAEIIDCRNSIYTLKFSFPGNFENLLYRIGNVPLPPYIKRSRDTSDDVDRRSYQTVYASQKGAVAAPTAGLHFTKKLLDKIKAMGIRIVAITLHVSYGTFLPVRVTDIRKHNMHSEWFHIPAEAADAINRTKANGNRIVAVGTTCTRALEFAADNRRQVVRGSGNCDLFIYPGYEFRVVDALITNFHLPKSTLLMLVCALAGRTKVLRAYQEAIKTGYRFYSYGDAMLIT